VVIDNFDLKSIATSPQETHPVLIVDPDAVLAFT
jgi:hypothetical protein